jgi:hypothetical protein
VRLIRQYGSSCALQICLRSSTLVDKTAADIAAEVEEFEHAMLLEWKATLAGRLGKQPSESWKELHRRAHKGQAELFAKEIHLLIPPARSVCDDGVSYSRLEAGYTVHAHPLSRQSTKSASACVCGAAG